jgi:hypothetical protein
MKSLVSFSRSSQPRAFAQQYSGFNTPAVFSSYDFIELRSTHDQSGRFIGHHASSSRRGAAGFRLVQKMAAPNKEAEEGWGRR